MNVDSPKEKVAKVKRTPIVMFSFFLPFDCFFNHPHFFHRMKKQAMLLLLLPNNQ
jgi:hypothetical protein